MRRGTRRSTSRVLKHARGFQDANGARPAPRDCGFGPRAAFIAGAILSRRSGVQRQRRLLIFAAADAAIGKNAMRGDPLERLLVDFLGIRLEYPPLAGSPASRIHQLMEAIGELVLV